MSFRQEPQPKKVGIGGTCAKSISLLSRYEKAEISQEKKNAYGGEAYFFKAWDYYQKVLLFGDVPWITYDLTEASEELYAPRDSRAEVMDSVLMCINKAVEWLPEKKIRNRSPKQRPS